MMELWNGGATRRFTSRAYDLRLVGVAFWFLYSSASGTPWVPWVIFMLANLAGLFVFNNCFFHCDLSLTKRWSVLGVLATMLVAGSFIFVLQLDSASQVMATLTLIWLVLVRLSIQPAESKAPTRRCRSD